MLIYLLLMLPLCLLPLLVPIDYDPLAWVKGAWEPIIMLVIFVLALLTVWFGVRA